MKKLNLFLLACAVLAVPACTPATSSDSDGIGAAQEAFVTYANPTAIKDAIDNGATWSGGALVISDVSNYCVLADGVWSLSSVSGDTMPRGAFRLIQNGTLITDPGEYQWCFDTAGGTLQLAEQDGVATLIDP